LVIGGYAVALHGHPRYTKDLDVWVELSSANAAKIVQALDRFGFSGLGLREQDFLESNQVVQLGHPPNRIDILTSLSGVSFYDCFERRVETEVEGVTVNLIALEDLKRNKQASGRLQDLADVESLGGA
jgi:hypothetical protein